MFYNLLAPLAEDFRIFNLFRYLTFRSGGAVLFAFFLALVIGPSMIRWLKKLQREGQPIRSDGPESHLLTKKGTPTMGGLMFLLSASILSTERPKSWARAGAVAAASRSAAETVFSMSKPHQGELQLHSC